MKISSLLFVAMFLWRSAGAQFIELGNDDIKVMLDGKWEAIEKRPVIKIQLINISKERLYVCKMDSLLFAYALKLNKDLIIECGGKVSSIWGMQVGSDAINLNEMNPGDTIRTVLDVTALSFQSKEELQDSVLWQEVDLKIRVRYLKRPGGIPINLINRMGYFMNNSSVIYGSISGITQFKGRL